MIRTICKSHFEGVCVHNLGQQQENGSNSGHFDLVKITTHRSSTLTHTLQLAIKVKLNILSGLGAKGNLKDS